MRAGQMDRDPYWSRPWPSAVALAKLILQQPSIVSGRRVCEVGAGLGIASISAALAGAELPYQTQSSAKNKKLKIPLTCMVPVRSQLGSFTLCVL